MDRRRLNRCVCLLVCGAVLLLWSDATRAQGRAKKPKTRKVSSWGNLGKPIRGSDFYEITYYKKTGSGRKTKVKKTKAFLKVTSKSLIYQDTRVAIGHLKTDEDRLLYSGPHTEMIVVPDGTAVAIVQAASHIDQHLFRLELEAPTTAAGLPRVVGEPQRLTGGQGRWHVHNGGWSPDGQSIVYTQDTDDGDIYMIQYQP